MKQTILITGMSGLIGSAVARRLAGRHDLRGLGRQRADAGVPWFTADIADLETIRPAFDGVGTVVHLAAAVPRRGAGWPEMLSANIIGTYNVFEAARAAGVERVIFASSGAVVSGWERDPPYSGLVSGSPGDVPASWPMLTIDATLRPGGLYGCSKVWGEALARSYADEHGMSVICLRIGHVTESDRPAASARSAAIWLSQRDAAQMVERCIDAPASLRFDTFYVSSKSRLGYRDLEHAREVVGYVPEDEA